MEAGLTVQIQKKYLAQLYNVSPDYAKGVFERLQQPQFDLTEVERLAQEAYTWYRNKAFLPSGGEKLMGYPPAQPVYGV